MMSQSLSFWLLKRHKTYRGGEFMAELKYLSLWKDGRLIFLKREDFERQSIWRRISKRIKRLIKR